jgi:2,4-dichlorophenol 6-monooxygenase
VILGEDDRHGFTEDAELVYQHVCEAGARLPHVWLVQRRRNYSSLDLVGQGRFTLLTGIGGGGWRKASAAATAALGVPVAVLTIGPDCDYEDPFGDWCRIRGVADDGAVLVRPDQFVAWRAKNRSGDQVALLTAALARVLGRN